jgi:glycosyltransferase involved in cell wall biosynthesis
LIKVSHIITGLAAAGAEKMLYRLVCGMDSSIFENEVISLTDLGPMAEKFQDCGIRVRALRMKPGTPNPYHVLRLARWLHESRPAVIQTWMYHANLIGGLAANLAGLSTVIWNIRHSQLDLRVDKRSTVWTARACAPLSRLTRLIICCSEAARRAHMDLGYPSDRMEVIPNGFDLETFKPNPAQRQAIRAELNLVSTNTAIGMVARFHPIKGHQNFLAAAGRLHRDFPNVRFLLCGEGVVPENRELTSWINGFRIADVCHLLGEREDIPQVMNAMDIMTSPSIGESFPNAVAEAMACGVPCVVTDVGDSGAILGETGRVVPPSSPDALAEAWRDLLDAGFEGRAQLGLLARQRIEQRFALKNVIERYQALYVQVAESGPARRRRKNDRVLCIQEPALRSKSDLTIDPRPQ